MPKTDKLVIFGTAEIAALAYYYFQNDTNYQVVGFCVDDEFFSEEKFQGLTVVPFSKVAKLFPPSSYEMHVALSYARFNKLREEKYLQAKAAGYKLASYICSRSTYWSDLSHGDNCFILEDQTIQPTVNIGNNVVIWSGNHIGHAVKINNHAYISSHVVLCGHSIIGERCFLGVNSAVRDFVEIADDCFVGMGSTITSNMNKGCVAITNSTSIWPAEDRRARAIKRGFFKK